MIMIPYQNAPAIINVLRHFPFRKTNYTIREAITEIKELQSAEVSLTQIEDPWVIIKTVRNYLSNWEQQPTLPIVKLKCCDKQLYGDF